MKTKLISYKGDTKLKEKYVQRAKAHRKADEIIHGKYWVGGKGCCIGCLAHSDLDAHEELEDQTGVSRIIHRLADGIFEGLPEKDYKDFVVNYVESIPVGVNLDYVFPSMMIFILKDCRKHARLNGKKAINNVIEAFEKQLNGEIISAAEWSELRAAAYAAAAYTDAAYAAYDAAYAAIDAAADAATYAAADAAAATYAAATYAAADAADVAKEKAFSRYAKELLRLLQNQINQ